MDEVVRIRPAVPEDVPGIRWLIQLLAEYEKEPHALKLSEEEMLRDGFGEEKFFHCLVAELTSPPDPSVATSQATATPESNGSNSEDLPSSKMKKNDRLVGYTLYFYIYSTWEGRALYMEDVFVRTEYRNRGIGSDLMRECAKVLDWNVKAQQLYDRMGAKCLHEWLTIRMDKNALEEFAAGTEDCPQQPIN